MASGRYSYTDATRYRALTSFVVHGTHVLTVCNTYCSIYIENKKECIFERILVYDIIYFDTFYGECFRVSYEFNRGGL